MENKTQRRYILRLSKCFLFYFIFEPFGQFQNLFPIALGNDNLWPIWSLIKKFDVSYKDNHCCYWKWRIETIWSRVISWFSIMWSSLEKIDGPLSSNEDGKVSNRKIKIRETDTFLSMFVYVCVCHTVTRPFFSFFLSVRPFRLWNNKKHRHYFIGKRITHNISTIWKYCKRVMFEMACCIFVGCHRCFCNIFSLKTVYFEVELNARIIHEIVKLDSIMYVCTTIQRPNNESISPSNSPRFYHTPYRSPYKVDDFQCSTGVRFGFFIYSLHFVENFLGRRKENVKDNGKQTGTEDVRKGNERGREGGDFHLWKLWTIKQPILTTIYILCMRHK